MANTPSTTLVLAATGKTGSRVAGRLRKLGLSVRTAARNGADASSPDVQVSLRDPILPSLREV